MADDFTSKLYKVSPLWATDWITYFELADKIATWAAAEHGPPAITISKRDVDPDA